MEYQITKYPKNKETDYSKLSEYQIVIRNKQRFYKYSSKKTCKQCMHILPIDQYYIKDKKTGRRSNICKDCILKNNGVLEIGKLRFAIDILKKGFRRCSVCKTIKNITEFSKSKNNYGGHSNNCYECSKKLHFDFMQDQQNEVKDFYVKQYALSNYGKNITDKEIEKYRNEILEKRKPKYFIDNLKFVTIANFARYIESEYKNPITMTEKRISEGKTEIECTYSENKMRSLAYTKGKIKVIDTITGKEFLFKNTQDEKLKKMFSGVAITRGIKTGEPTRITKLSKYKNPCIISRIKA
jgi:hypothetical protein